MKSPDLQRIEHIRDYCASIQSTILRCQNSYEIFESDLDFQYSISFSILQIGELSGKLSEEFRSRFSDRIPWRQIKDMRNFLVHNYGSVDLLMTWETAVGNIPELLAFCEEILRAQP